MGTCSGTSVVTSEDRYIFIQGEEETHKKFQAPIPAMRPTLDPKVVRAFEGLKTKKTLYKDTLSIQPVEMMSKFSNPKTKKCIFMRAFNLISNDYSRIVPTYDQINSRASQIIVNDDVKQYLGVFFCFLADTPRLIPTILLVDVNAYGLYAVQILKNNVKQVMYIDDYILCNSSKDPTPIFTQIIEVGYIWACILEKAWLQTRQQTEIKICKHSPQDVFEAFLPYPIRNYLLKPENAADLLYHTLLNPKKGFGYVLISKKVPSHFLGLSGSKPYYFLGSFSFQGQNLFALRNPCLGQFRGNFQEAPGIDQIAKQKGIEKVNGNFFLSEQELIEQIEQIMVCQYFEGANNLSSDPISLGVHEEKYIGFKLKNPSTVSLNLKQTLQISSDQYIPISYQVFELKSNTIISGNSNPEGCFGTRDLYLCDSTFKQLPAGSYLIRIKEKSNLRHQNLGKVTYELQANCSDQIPFDYLAVERLQESFFDFLTNLGKTQLREKNLVSLKNKQDFDHVVYWIGDLVVIYIQKDSKIKKPEIKLEISFPETTNLISLKPKNLGKGYSSLPSFKENTLIIFEKIDLTAETKLSKYTLESF